MTTRKKKSDTPKPGRPRLARGTTRIVLPAQRISPLAHAVLTPERVRGYGGVGKLLDAALLALPSVERAMGVRAK